MSMTIQQALDEAGQQLLAVADDSVLEASLLLAHTLDRSRSYLFAWPEQILSEEALTSFRHSVGRRCQREPIAYITGVRDFWSLSLQVNRETLIPRPETELLVELVLELFTKEHRSIQIADLGTGSGAVALAIAHERPSWAVYAIDNSQPALKIAENNAQQLGIKNISFCLGHWCTALPAIPLDVIVSNPPYIAETEWVQYADGLSFEPRAALVSGEDGLSALREIGEAAKYYLKPGGYILVEHGYGQGQAVRDLFVAKGYQAVHTICDVFGQERVTMGCLPINYPVKPVELIK